MKNNLILGYAKANCEKMFREPAGALKYKYIVPGSVYDDELWDWDSFFTNIALRQFIDFDISEYEKGCILNFLHNMDSNGRIPIAIVPSFDLDKYEKRPETNIHKPCLVQHALFICTVNNDYQWLKPHFAKLCKFVDYYIGNCRHANGIYYWIDDQAIGADNDPATFYRPKKSSGSILLNCFMYKELLALCAIGKKLGENVSKYEGEAVHLKNAIQMNCYDEKDGMFYSVDLNLLPIDPNKSLHAGAPRNWDCLIQRLGYWSCFLPLWCGIATKEQAERMVKENLLDEKAFWAPYGVRSLSKYEKMYQIRKSGNPSCWLGPVWGVSNYLVFRGLIKYGYISVANDLAEKTVNLLEMDIADCGDLHEYYDPEDGHPVMNKGFQSWNLLAVNLKAWLSGEQIVTEE